MPRCAWRDRRTPRVSSRWAEPLNGVAGTVAVLFGWALLRRSLGPGWALYGASLLAAAPMLVVHAHYLKEDMLLLAGVLAAILALCRFLEERPLAVWALGIATGLACSAHYKGALLAGVYVLVPFVVSTPDVGRYYRRLGAGLVIAAGTFLAIDLPMLRQPLAALSGASFEARHAVHGHHVIVDERWHSVVATISRRRRGCCCSSASSRTSSSSSRR